MAVAPDYNKRMQILWCALLLGGISTLAGCANTTSSPVPSRPLDLIAALPSGELKTRLSSCSLGPSYRSDFSIAHRGAPFGYPEHTREGYIAAAAMGAGRIECDVTFTEDLALVCRHSQCDLHRTTNILQTPLAAACTAEFKPASEGETAGAQCCTSDITLAQYRTLCGRRDIVNPQAEDVDAYLTAPKSIYAPDAPACGTLMTHAESITLIDALGADFIPELKSPAVPMPFAGMSQQDYAARMLAEYGAANIDPQRVHPQSFNLNDVLYWITSHPNYAQNSVFLDPRGRQPDFKATLEDMQELRQTGVQTIAPPIAMLVTLDDQGQLTQTQYARYAKQAGLKIVTWTFEAGDATDPTNWIYGSIPGFIDRESKMLEVLDFLYQEVGISGLFSDWPGTVTHYANCVENETVGA